MSYETLRLERSGHVAIIRLNRPDVLNALDRQLTREFHLALDEVGEEFPVIRVLILTGEGRGFCSGADMTQMGRALAQNLPRQTDDDSSSYQRIQELAPRLRGIPQPTIAAINGAATGAGLSIALA